MQKIKALLLVRDPSFIFYVHYPDLPFKKKIKTPEGNIEVYLLTPTSGVSKSRKEPPVAIPFGQLMIWWAEKSLDDYSDLSVECSVLVVLEKEIESEIIGKYKSWRDYIDKMNERVECEKVIKQIDIEAVEHDRSVPELPEYHLEMFNVCRKYLKRFLLSLREKGNVCKLRFHDYNQPELEYSSGLFGKYYFDFQLQDKKGNLLFDMSPFSPFMKEKMQKKKFIVSSRISQKGSPRKDEVVINANVWERICKDLAASEFEPNLGKTFLLDAQDALLSGNISMAVVSTAIACEIFTDRFISIEAKKIGNEFYDYIIDKEPGISVIDLLDVPLKSLVGYSIKEKNRDLWNDLQKLFQARNKVAHEGKCFYRSTTGKTQNLVDHKQAMHFIERAYELFEILGAIGRTKGMSVKF